MPDSNFNFLQSEWPDLHDAASKAEAMVYPDARTACFHARRGLEVMVHWLYKHDAALKLPYQDNLSALIHEPTFKTTAGAAVFARTVLINRLGNSALHGHRPVQQFDALTAVRELFHVAYWLAHTYLRARCQAGGRVDVWPEPAKAGTPNARSSAFRRSGRAADTGAVAAAADATA